MFTGIIQAMGRIASIERRSADAGMQIQVDGFDMNDVFIGDSIAVSGVCLTVTSKEQDRFWVDVSGETLACTTLGTCRPADPVNLEKALTLSTRLGGHLVSGHIDDVGEMVKRSVDGRSVRMVFKAPTDLAKYIAAKGSICIEGISLTVNRVTGIEFEINVIPHTLEQTTLKYCVPGTRINLEVDLVARYLERLLLGDDAVKRSTPSISHEFLARYGYLSDDYANKQ